jgi:hypothetical protein
MHDQLSCIILGRDLQCCESRFGTSEALEGIGRFDSSLEVSWLKNGVSWTRERPPWLTVVSKVSLGGTRSPIGACVQTCWKLRRRSRSFSTLHTSLVSAHGPLQVTFVAVSNHLGESVDPVVLLSL